MPKACPMASDSKTDLYRHFDADGNLLYIGVSTSALTRFKQHKHRSSWVDKVRTITIEKYSDRQSAFAAEKDAIEKERPPYNYERRKPVKAKAPEESPVIPDDWKEQYKAARWIYQVSFDDLSEADQWKYVDAHAICMKYGDMALMAGLTQYGPRTESE